MSESVIAEIRRSAGNRALDGVDLDRIDADGLLRQSHLDLAQRAKPGTPLYALTFAVSAFVGDVWQDHLRLSSITLAVLLAIGLWRNHAITQVIRRKVSASVLRWPMILSSTTFGIVTGGMAADHGLDVTTFLLLLCSGVFSVIGCLLTSIERHTSTWFVFGGIFPILVGLGWHFDAPRLAVFAFLVLLLVTAQRLSSTFRGEYWRQLIANAVVERQRQDLEIAQRSTAEAQRVRDDLLRNFTHELRTPMNGVLGILGLVESQNDPEERRQLLSLAAESAERMLDQVNRVLDVETPRLEQTLRPSVVHPRIFFEEWVDHFAPAARKKGLRIKLRVQEDVPADLVLDRVRLRSIVVNLLDNAVKFTDEGRIDVFVYGVPIDEFVFRLGVAVRDTGPGVPHERREEIFESYRQLDASVTRAHGGLGLGLAIVRMQARLMGGNVDVSSEEGEGSTFRAEVEARIPQTGRRETVPQASAEEAPVTNA